MPKVLLSCFAMLTCISNTSSLKCIFLLKPDSEHLAIVTSAKDNDSFVLVAQSLSTIQCKAMCHDSSNILLSVHIKTCNCRNMTLRSDIKTVACSHNHV